MSRTCQSSSAERGQPSAASWQPRTVTVTLLPAAGEANFDQRCELPISCKMTDSRVDWAKQKSTDRGILQ